MTSSSVTFSVVPLRALCQIPLNRDWRNHCSRTLSSAFTNDDWDAVTHCFDPRQQQFVFMRSCHVTVQYGGDTPVVSHGTLRVGLSTHSAHKHRPRAEFKLCKVEFQTFASRSGETKQKPGHPRTLQQPIPPTSCHAELTDTHAHRQTDARKRTHSHKHANALTQTRKTSLDGTRTRIFTPRVPSST